MPNGMIERTHPKLSAGAQCQVLSISRSPSYHEPPGETARTLDPMLPIDKQFLKTPFYGVRQVTWHFQNEGHAGNEKRIRRLMRLMRVRRENSPPDCFLTLLAALLPKAQHRQALEGAQNLPLPAKRVAHRQAQSGLVPCLRYPQVSRCDRRTQGRRQLPDQCRQFGDEGVLLSTHSLFMLAGRTLRQHLELHGLKGLHRLGWKVWKLAGTCGLRAAGCGFTANPDRKGQ
jgi:hypothetical protein